MSKQSLIYVGRCLPTNKVYVGSTIQGKRRILSHVRDLNKSKHSNNFLQRAWIKYGESAFTWHVVEVCKSDELLLREQWWIDFLRATDDQYGFNLLNPITGRSNNKSNLSLVQVEKWRDPVVRGKRLVGLKKLHTDQEWKSRRAKAMAARWAMPEWRNKMLKVLSSNVKGLQARMADEPGFKEQRMRGIQPTKLTKIVGRV